MFAIDSGWLAQNGGGINGKGTAAEILNCVIEDNYSGYDGGGIFDVDGDIINCVITGNTAAQNGGGLEDCDGDIINCTIVDNSATAYGGLNNCNGSGKDIANNIIWNNTGTGDQIAGYSGATVADNCIESQTISGNISSDPKFVDADGADNDASTIDDNDYHIAADSPCIDGGEDSHIISGDVDMDGDDRINATVDIGADEYYYTPASGNIYYVDASATSGANNGSSWANAYTKLQDALDEAVDSVGSDEIWVAGGTYYPDEDVVDNDGAGGYEHLNDARDEAFTLIANLKLYGGFPAGGAGSMNLRDWAVYETILSGDIDGNGLIDYNSYHVVEASRYTILDGFLITKGYANGPDQWSISGGGIYASGVAVYVSNCTVKENRSNAGNYLIGGGAGVYAYYGDQTFTNCIFEDNRCWNSSYGQGGGGMLCNSSSVTLVDCVFLNNQCWRKAGGLYLSEKAKAATLINCTFDNNYGSALASAVHMYTDKHSYETHEFTDCTFINNRVSGAAKYTVFIWNDSAIFTGCTFTDNLATPIFLVNYDSQEETTITDCVFSGNTAKWGGGIWGKGTRTPFTVSNCLFANNTALYEGGAICIINNPATIINCTFTGNSAGNEGEGIWISTPLGGLTLTNSILWGNNGSFESDQIYIDSGDYSINYCCIQGLTGNLGGAGNIGDSPDFVDETNDNYRLNSNSPCIDKGDNNANGEPYDLDGNTRKIDGNGDQEIDIDMGPYEYQAP